MNAYIKIPIADATDQQLREFCELQQLDGWAGGSRAELLAIIETAWAQDWVFVASASPELDEDEAAAAAQQVQAAVPLGLRVTGGTGANDPIFVVRIGNAPVPGGDQPVPVGVNGKTVVLQRNMTVELPARYFYALESAIREEVTQDQKTGELNTMQVTAYPVQVITRPSDSELREWRERTDNELLPA